MVRKIATLAKQLNRSQLLFGLINLCIWFPFLAMTAEEYFSTYRSDLAFLGFFSIHAPFAIALYSNWLVLIPKLLARQRYVRYLFSLVGMGMVLSLLSSLNPAFHGMMTTDPDWWQGMSLALPASFGIIMLMHLLATPLFLSFGWFSQQHKIQELANANLQKEMAVLKAQFNPHFIFNSLNNIYSLALDKSDLAPDMIMRLSKLLRYTSYQGRRDWVDLTEEIRFLEDYLELQKIRLRNGETVRFRAAVDHAYPVDVPPLLLILPIENAIKHGVETMGAAAYVHIDLVQHDDWLNFRVSNNYDPTKLPGSVGIGLEQLRRRLALRYGADFKLEIDRRNGVFDLRLDIPLRQADSELLDLSPLSVPVLETL